MGQAPRHAIEKEDSEKLLYPRIKKKRLSSEPQNQLFYNILVFLTLLTQIKPHYPLKPAGIQIFERIQKIFHLLNEISSSPRVEKLGQDPNQLNKLINLKNHLQELQTTHQELQDQVKTFYHIMETIRDLFRDEGLAEEEALKKFQGFISHVRNRAKRKTLKDTYREGYETLLKTMRAWKKKLFKFKSMPRLPRTNNSLEKLFNEKKRWLRRTSGVRQGNRTFKLFGKYIMFIDSALTREEITRLLNQADYEKCIHKLKAENENASKRFLSKQKARNWDTDFENFCKKIFMSVEVS